MIVALFLACDGGKDSNPTESTPNESAPDSVPTADLWDHCTGAYEGDTSWVGLVKPNSNALYCSASNEARTLPEELAAKAELRVIPGSWAVPSVEGDFSLSLPVCAMRKDNAISMGGVGSTTVSPQSFAGTTYTYLDGVQPLSDSLGASWSLAHTLVLVGDEGADPDPLVLDGYENSAESGTGATFVLYPEGGDRYATSAMTFAPCMDPSWTNNVHTVTFEGGSIEIELYLGDDPIITAPGNFVHASGTLDGTDFDITNFYQLIYRPGHHHMTRNFAVLFDAPIGSACGLLVEDTDMQQGTTTSVVSLADCGLAAIEARSVTAEELVLK